MLISIPPKYSVSGIVGYIKGKSAIHVESHFLKRERNYAGQRLWARGYFVDTVAHAAWWMICSLALPCLAATGIVLAVRRMKRRSKIAGYAGGV